MGRRHIDTRYRSSFRKKAECDYNTNEEIRNMIKVYVMESCPDCVEVKQRYSNDPGFELIDIGKQARDLKEFLVLRDTHPAFVKVRERGNIGIPCFIKEDGTIIISLKKFDDSFEPVYAEGAACNLDGTGC